MKRFKRIASSIFLFLCFACNQTYAQEYIVFNAVRYTSSKTNNQLNNIQNISGSGFKFTSQNSTFALSKTSNNINGTLTYINSSGTKISYSGSIEGKFISNGQGSPTIGLYFISGTNYFILVVPGYESDGDLDDNDDPSFNSSGIETAVDALKTTQQASNNVVVTMGDASATESSSTTYATFTLSFTQNRSLNNTITFTPTLTNGTATSGDDFSTSMSYSTDNSNWTAITTTVSVAYDKNTVYIRCSITDDTRPECVENFTLSTGTLTHSGTREVDNYSGVYGIGTINDNNDPLIWNGSSSTNWDLAANWTPNDLSPGSCYYVQIPASLSRYPDFISSSTNTTIAGLNIASGAKLKLTSGTLSVKGPVVNDDNTNGVYGDGTLELNGTSAQTISGTGLFHNVKINNAAGVSLSSGSTIITGILTPTAGEITTNGRLVFRQNATDHGEVGQITGCPRTVFTGNVTIERYIPASNRSFRLLTPGVTTSTSIKQNWQENSNVTDPNAYPNTTAGTNNPNPGYGMHITGSTTGQDGFDATLTGNPSMFTFNNATQQWGAIGNTNTNTFSVGQAYRVLIRGSRATDLRTNVPVPDNTILRVTGTLKTCSYVFNTTDSPIRLTGTSGDFSFIGNPFWSIVDWSSLSTSGVEDNLYYWDPTLNGTNNRGVYVTYNRSTNLKSNNSSNVDRYIQPGQAFFVKSTSSSPSVTFTEDKKSNGNRRSVFQKNESIEKPVEGSEAVQTDQQITNFEKLSVVLKINGMANRVSADGCLLIYGKEFSNAYGREDASKMSNLDENIALVNDEIKHAILGKKSDQILSNDTTHISLWNLYEKTYTLEIDPRGMANDQKIYFVNNKNNTSTLLKNNQLFEYEFQPRAGEKTINDFSIIVGNQKGIEKNVERLLIYPNPAKYEIQFILPNHEIANWAKIFDTNGKLIITTPIKQAENKLRTSNLPKGNYLLEIKTANRSFTSMFNKL